MGPVERSIKEYIMSEYLEGEDPNEITESTPLITTGVIDSMATLKLALFLEQTFSISLAPQEMTAEHMDTVGQIADLVNSKTART